MTEAAQLRRKTKQRKRQRDRYLADKEVARLKLAAGLRNTFGRVDPECIAERLAEIPVDTRDLTARLMGDPIPNDPRRHGPHSQKSEVGG